MRTALAAALALIALCAPAAAADAFSTDWAAGAKWRARLIAAGDRLAGFEITLAPGAITYWRDPGDSGLPPTLDFAASDNVEAVEPAFPAPKRIKEADGGEAFGYDGGVIFPLRVKPRDAAKPVDARAQRRFRRLRESVPAGQGAPQADPAAPPPPRPTRARSTRRSPPSHARLRRRTSARLRPTAPRAGASARRTKPDRRATCSSSRPRAGG